MKTTKLATIVIVFIIFLISSNNIARSNSNSNDNCIGIYEKALKAITYPQMAEELDRAISCFKETKNSKVSSENYQALLSIGRELKTNPDRINSNKLDEQLASIHEDITGEIKSSIDGMIIIMVATWLSTILAIIIHNHLF